MHQVVDRVPHDIFRAPSRQRRRVSLPNASRRLYPYSVGVDHLASQVGRVGHARDADETRHEIPERRPRRLPAKHRQSRNKGEQSDVQIPMGYEEIVCASIGVHFFLRDEPRGGCHRCTDRRERHQAATSAKQAVTVRERPECIARERYRQQRDGEMNERWVDFL